MVLATTPEDNAQVFADHFEKLYGRRPSYDPTVIDLLKQREVTLRNLMSTKR